MDELQQKFEEYKKNCTYCIREKSIDGKHKCGRYGGLCNLFTCKFEPYVEVDPTLEEPKPSMSEIVDIQAIINDAMEKKDRYVSIFISPSGTNIMVNPLDDKKPRWIYAEERGMYYLKCSECDSLNSFSSPYCPNCGEKLAAPEEEKDDRTDNT